MSPSFFRYVNISCQNLRLVAGQRHTKYIVTDWAHSLEKRRYVDKLLVTCPFDPQHLRLVPFKFSFLLVSIVGETFLPA